MGEGGRHGLAGRRQPVGRLPVASLGKWQGRKNKQSDRGGRGSGHEVRSQQTHPLPLPEPCQRAKSAPKGKARWISKICRRRSRSALSPSCCEIADWAAATGHLSLRAAAGVGRVELQGRAGRRGLSERPCAVVVYICPYRTSETSCGAPWCSLVLCTPNLHNNKRKREVDGKGKQSTRFPATTDERWPCNVAANYYDCSWMIHGYAPP
ncbi:hypothetical protein F5Y15DRAFT_213997 [Xylariaceae sp. FL0016]|nr:hypothetical protein F5Y15DRAFT_213997 [Xylariaceae sp. FL0016]